MVQTRKKSKRQIKQVVVPPPVKELPIRSPWIADQGWCVWLKDDPQSVSAMLRGRGDGREKLYAKYVQYWKKRNPTLSEETLHAGYAEYALYMDRQVDRDLQQPSQQAQQLRHNNSFAFLIGTLSKHAPSTMKMLGHIAQHWIGIALVGVLTYGAARYL